MTSTTTIATYATNGAMFNAFDASLIVDGALQHITAIHGHDKSTAAAYAAAAPDSVMVSLRPITNGKAGRGRRLADTTSKAMLSPCTVLALSKAC